MSEKMWYVSYNEKEDEIILSEESDFERKIHEDNGNNLMFQERLKENSVLKWVYNKWTGKKSYTN